MCSAVYDTVCCKEPLKLFNNKSSSVATLGSLLSRYCRDCEGRNVNHYGDELICELLKQIPQCVNKDEYISDAFFAYVLFLAVAYELNLVVFFGR